MYNTQPVSISVIDGTLNVSYLRTITVDAPGISELEIFKTVKEHNGSVTITSDSDDEEDFIIVCNYTYFDKDGDLYEDSETIGISCNYLDAKYVSMGFVSYLSGEIPGLDITYVEDDGDTEGDE